MSKMSIDRNAASRPRRNYDLEKLRRRQKEMASRIIVQDCFAKPIRRVTGFDVAYLDDEAVVAAVTLQYSTSEVVEKKTMMTKVSFPYISTFLGLREGPLIIRLAENLRSEPDILMINSQGIAHPRFYGCACHIGLCLSKPTIGVAGRRLCGEYECKPEEVGDSVPLKYQERIVGAVLLSKLGCKPIFVSVGHMISLPTAIETVKHFLASGKLPEPLRLAHGLANALKREAMM